MILANSALLRIEVEPISNAIQLKVIDNQDGQAVTLESHVNLKSIRTSLREDIEDLKYAISNLEHFDINQLDMAELSNVATALQELYLKGRSLYFDFFMDDPNHAKVRAVHDLFRTHYDNLSDRSVYDSEQGIVEIKSDFNDTIPLEFFVLPDEPSAKITTKTDLHKIVTRFLARLC